jgi:hypothetical protein
VCDRFVTPRFLRPAKSGVRPWRRRKRVRKIFALPPSVALHDSDAAKVLRYEAFQRSNPDRRLGASVSLISGIVVSVIPSPVTAKALGFRLGF